MNITQIQFHLYDRYAYINTICAHIDETLYFIMIYSMKRCKIYVYGEDVILGKTNVIFQMLSYLYVKLLSLLVFQPIFIVNNI